MIQVELDIFSGRPNPTWFLTEKQEQELVDRVVADPSILLPFSQVTPRLGYRGYILHVSNESEGPWMKARLSGGGSLPSFFRIGGGGVSAETPLWFLQTAELNGATISTCVADATRDGALGDVQAKVDAQEHALDKTPTNGAITLGPNMSCASTYLTGTNFDFWNNQYEWLRYNNCYNFASNYRIINSSIGFAQPGLQGGNPVSFPSFSNMSNAIRADGWGDGCGSTDNISICYAIWPNTDFHFFRLCWIDGVYIWGHKPGCTPARTTDFGNPSTIITNPETCNRGNYTVFGEYFYTYRSRTVNGPGVPPWCL
jgi:hypothetical protein